MGIINSRHLRDDNQNKSKYNYNDDANNNTPVMGDGYCPIYDAALVGDWNMLETLCEEQTDVAAAGVSALLWEDDTENNDKKDGDGGGDGDVDDTNNKYSGCNGGHHLDVSGSAKKVDDGDGSRSQSTLMLADCITSLDVFNGGSDYTYTLDMSVPKQKQQQKQEQEPSSPPPRDKDNNKGETTYDDKDDGKEDAMSEETSPTVSISSQQQPSPQPKPQQQQQPYTLFIDAKGNTPLHLACRRDPPLSAIRALLSLHSASVWMTTADGWIPLHLACHCGCDVVVANELLNVMEASLEERHESLQSKDDDGEQQHDDQEENDGNNNNNKDMDEVDPLLPRDKRGRTPLHLACASSRDPIRRPDLVRLLLLRSTDPRRAALARDWVDFDQRVGVDLAWGELKVIVGGLNNSREDKESCHDDNSTIDTKEENNSTDDSDNKAAVPNGMGKTVVVTSNGGSSAAFATTKSIGKQQQQPPPATNIVSATPVVGRTPLNLIEDDYREELEEALLPGFSIANAIAACRGEDISNAASGDGVDVVDAPPPSNTPPDNLDAMYECWAMLSVLILSAGTPGTAERVKEALGGEKITDPKRNNSWPIINRQQQQQQHHENATDNKNDNKNSLLNSFTKPCHDVVQDFQAIYQACQSSDDACPVQFKELSKKFLQGQVDKRSIASVSDLKNQWESRSQCSRNST